MKWFLRIAAVLAVLIVIALFSVYLMINGFAKTQIETQGTAATGSATTLDSIKLGLFTGSASLDDFALANPTGFGDDPIFKFNDADVKVKIGSLMGDEVVVPKVHIDGAEVVIALQGTKLNAKVLMDEITKRGQSDDAGTDGEEPEPDAGGDAKGFVINDLRITNTKVKGSLEIIPGQPPVKIDLVLADIVKTDVRGAEMKDVIAFVLQTVMANATRSAAEVTPELGDFIGGLGDVAGKTVDDVAGKIDAALPGAGGLLGDKAKDGIGGFLNKNKPEEKEPAPSE